MSNITEIFERLAKENDLTIIGVDRRLKSTRTEYNWSSIVHWDGHSNKGIACASGDGPTPEVAIFKALSAARNDRTPRLDAEIELITIGDVA
jgi:hypothetical protein